jgi:hypothetical protein
MGDLRIHKRKSNDNDSPKLIHIDIKIPEETASLGLKRGGFIGILKNEKLAFAV